MALKKSVNGVVVEMTPDEEAAFVAMQEAMQPPVPIKAPHEKLLEALVAEGIVPGTKLAAIRARL